MFDVGYLSTKTSINQIKSILKEHFFFFILTPKLCNKSLLRPSTLKSTHFFLQLCDSNYNLFGLFCNGSKFFASPTPKLNCKGEYSIPPLTTNRRQSIVCVEHLCKLNKAPKNLLFFASTASTMANE